MPKAVGIPVILILQYLDKWTLHARLQKGGLMYVAACKPRRHKHVALAKSLQQVDHEHPSIVIILFYLLFIILIIIVIKTINIITLADSCYCCPYYEASICAVGLSACHCFIVFIVSVCSRVRRCGGQLRVSTDELPKMILQCP